MSEDLRMTEAEWRQHQARQECARFGHDWQIISTLTGPIGLVCERPCGHRGYRIVPKAPTAAGEGARGEG
jgi:hypothetical protein